jgi:chorismate dehydratase
VTLRCGRIAYTNDLPIYGAFDAGAVMFPGSLRADVPSRLNALLLDGELDLGPISAFEWAKHAGELVLLPDLCIGARAEVVSVVLVSATPPALLDNTPIYVTQESATGRNLLRVILERRYGIAAAYVEETHPLERARTGAAALLIGDAAIDAVETFPAEHVYDLGRLWHEWTGADTVFAVWTARRDAYERDPNGVRACMRAFANAYAWSRGHGNQVVALAERTIPRPPGFYESYYAKLNFTFDTAAQRGLAMFCRELHAIGAIRAVPSTAPEVIDAVAR